MVRNADEYAKWLEKLPDRIAALVGKTYSVMGDDWKLKDDEALWVIRELLDEGDPTLIERNKDKRLNRRRTT